MIESILIEKREDGVMIVIKGKEIKLLVGIFSLHLKEYKIKRYLKSSKGIYFLIQNGSIIEVIREVNKSIEYLVSIERKY